MARILDFYRIRWEYEPHTFPILWNLDGAVVESFSPDFWLPDLDLYLEMTTLRQKLVRKKNRKLRRIRELYPDIRVKLFYARDFRALMLKFGRLALADALSGTSGQVVPERASPRSTCSTRPISSRPPTDGRRPVEPARRRRSDRRPDRPRRRHRRGPRERGADRGQGRRARAPGSAPTTPTAG